MFANILTQWNDLAVLRAKNNFWGRCQTISSRSVFYVITDWVTIAGIYLYLGLNSTKGNSISRICLWKVSESEQECWHTHKRLHIKFLSFHGYSSLPEINNTGLQAYGLFKVKYVSKNCGEIHEKWIEAFLSRNLTRRSQLNECHVRDKYITYPLAMKHYFCLLSVCAYIWIWLLSES